LIRVPQSMSGSVTVPASVTTIGNCAFSFCVNITAITLPAGLTTINREAFDNCRELTAIVIPAGVTIINPTTFRACEKLTSITIPTAVASIGTSAFAACIGLTSVTFERNSNTTIAETNAFPGNLVSASGGTGDRNRFGTYIITTPGNNPSWTKQ